jgi:hypothetical protein
VFALIRKRSDGPGNAFLNINHFNRLLLVVSLAADPAHFGASQPPLLIKLLPSDRCRLKAASDTFFSLGLAHQRNYMGRFFFWGKFDSQSGWKRRAAPSIGSSMNGGHAVIFSDSFRGRHLARWHSVETSRVCWRKKYF